MAKQHYRDPNSGETISFQVASNIIELPDECRDEWVDSYKSGNLSKLIISSEGTVTRRYEGFHLDVDTRRVKKTDGEIQVDLAALLPPFISVSVLFAIQETYSPFSIGPHMNDNYDLSIARQLGEFLRKRPELNNVRLTEEIPLSLCLKEPYLLNLSPDQHLFDEEDFRRAMESLNYHSQRGCEIWPVSICIEPLPSPDIEETLTCRSSWTNGLTKAWFVAEQLISKYCSEATINGRFVWLVNSCLWLFMWSEASRIESEAEDDMQGGPIYGLKKIMSEWSAWSQIHALDLSQRQDNNYVPDWSMRRIKDIGKILKNSTLEALTPSFNTCKLSLEQKAVLLALPSQYNLVYNPLAIAGSTLARIVADKSIISPGVSLCANTFTRKEKDGFYSLNKCGQVYAKQIKESPSLPDLCNGNECLLNSEVNLGQIWDRQKEIEGCIGNEQCFGIKVTENCKDISDLWRLSNQYLYIVDRYFKIDSLKLLASVPQGIRIRLMMSDDDRGGQNRRTRLKNELLNNPLPFLEVKIVSCSQGASSHPLHDRYVFSSDWGASLSSSLDAINSNALWAFKIEGYLTLQQRYFDYFWLKPDGVSHPYGPRCFTVNSL